MFAKDLEFNFLTLEVRASSDLGAHRLVTQLGNYPAHGGLAFGVTRAPMAAGQRGAVDVMAFAKVEAGAAFATDVPLMAGADGTVVAHDGNGSHLPIGRSVSDAQPGEVVSVWLIPCAGLPVNAA